MGVNTLRFRDVYQGGRGWSTAAIPNLPAGSSAQLSTGEATLTAFGTRAARGPVTGAPLTLGSGIATWLAFLALVLGFMLLGQHLGDKEDFRSIRLTGYNAVTVGMLAIVGILFFKFVFFTIRIPYVSDLIAGT